MTAPKLEAGFDSSHRGKIRKAPSQSVIDNLIRPGFADDASHKSYQDYLDINKAHVLMLAKQGIIRTEVARAILAVTQEMAAMGEQPAFEMDPNLEDSYFCLERYLIQHTSLEIGGQQHTARSRNDLFATSQRMKFRRYYFKLCEQFLGLRRAILATAERNKESVLAGYTHLQPSEPITFAHYLSAVLSALDRDYHRFSEAYLALDRCPLGGGSMGSTTWNIDREMTADLLGFSEPIDNSIDCVAARDYALDMTSAMAAVGNTLSRLCFDLYIWATPDYGYVEVDDSVAVCSSIMPQKKNPWTLEHVKGKVGHLEGLWISVFSALKNTPYTHNQDVNGESVHLLWLAMQEMQSCFELMTDTVSTLVFHKERAAKTALGNFCTAAELANTIVRADGISFRTAHEIVAEVVNQMIARDLKANEIGRDIINPIFKAVVGRDSALTDDEIQQGLDPVKNAMSKTVLGGTAPCEVSRQLARRQAGIERDQKQLDERLARVKAAKERLEAAVNAAIA